MLFFRKHTSTAHFSGLVKVIFICFPLWLQAQPTTIKGYAPHYNGKRVSVSAYKDLITMTPVELASTQINDSGKFTFRLDSLKHCTYIYLNIDNYKGDMYVVPGNLYQIRFPAPDTNHYQNPYIEHNVELVFYVHDTMEVNSLISDFNGQFDKFWLHNYQYFVSRHARHCLDSFYNAMIVRYTNVSNPDFKGYMIYTIAEIENNILESQKALGEKYIQGKPILYDNYQYMQFFNDYFKGYMKDFTFTMNGGDINKFIASPDYPNLMEVLKIKRLLRNDSLCELVLLKGLYEFYYSGDYPQENIRMLLKTIVAQTKIEEDRIIANDMLASFSGIVRGEQAPDFALKSSQGDVNSILDFRGKYTYLAFFKTTSSASVSQMQVIPAFYKAYRKNINFVFICEDENYDDLVSFVNANKTFNWTFLWDEKHKVMQEYGVEVLPQYFLINPQGRFFRSPADDPSHGIQTTFDEITKPKKIK